jgi:hypothetical protein
MDENTRDELFEMESKLHRIMADLEKKAMEKELDEIYKAYVAIRKVRKS